MPVKRCKHKNLKGKFTTIFGKGVVQLFKLQEIHLPACPVPWHRSPNMLDASNLRWSDTDWYCRSWPPKTVMDRWISEYLPTTVKCSFIIIDLIRITNLAMATGPLVIFSLVDSASVQNCQVTLWLLIKSGLLSGHFRWLLDNELLTAKKSNKSYDSLSVCPGALCITLSGTGGEMLQVRERLREVSCRYVAWRCSNSCKCLKWSPRIEAGRGSTKGSCACWKYAVSWCAPKRSSFLREPVSSIYLSGPADFCVPYVMYCLEDAVLRLPRTGYSWVFGIPRCTLYPTCAVI